MKIGKLNVITDGQFGSCGKGLITTFLASKNLPRVISTTNMANAGHTAVNDNGDAFIAKTLPSATILHKWINGYNPLIVVGASSAFTIDQLFKEMAECDTPDVLIHERAGVITEAHKHAESSGTKHLASTMQGCGAFLADKVLRSKDVRLARDYPELARFIKKDSLPTKLKEILMNGETILHEGSQGFSLDINHGAEYPYCTSRGTTAMQNMADLGLSWKDIGHVYLVIRPFPIRVGNVIENGEQVGFSGGCYEDQKEISWKEVAEHSGMPDEIATSLLTKELTTVTKRLRRVFTFSEKQLREAVLVNGATHIALNFANYIDWGCYGRNDEDILFDFPKINDFVRRIEDVAQIPVSLLGTGPQNNHVAVL